MQETPLVSICCMAYNHEKFIKEAIEGFLMQKTNFPFEIVIHDDASTDKTAEIIKSYEEKHPELFVTKYQTVNQYSQGLKPTVHFLYPKARGKYIALCEGDDYWTDPYKLQKQVDFLEENAEYVICFHNAKINKHGELLDDYITRKVPETTDILELAKGNYMHTPTVIFKRKWQELPDWFSKCSAGDYALHMINAQFGKIKKLDDVMAVYRVHGSNIWANQKTNEMAINIHKYLDVMLDKFPDEVNSIILKRYNAITIIVIKYFYQNDDIENANLYFKKLVANTTSPTILHKYLAASTPKKASYHVFELKQKMYNKLSQLISSFKK
ncbi:glycosyltransferase family 2 protein [Alkalitalea saponilacus]|uniref:Glycosyl transferase family 2 n=1 Tax=Alkalitalea saponilacus TaxID=889453 RepID=A0A1T5H0B8_9BACT|nr:glycosyltransferase [Alkalitalea saponilacus]ASB50954.1 hypothetical protein CDL62_18280 [Alkalitalea saponilacus]SKC14031.1 Glycosyl transferase family 2 [Alkalitalea saponilacus]